MFQPFPPRKSLIFAVVAVVFCVQGLQAAPLEGGFALAPRSSASPEEKTAAYREARFKVLSAAASYEKTPYRYGGLDKKGLDCSGLVYLSFREALGVTVPRTTGSLYSWVEKIQIANVQPGDLLFFKTVNNGSISHVGMYVGGRRFIHAASEGPVTGVIYSSLDENYWTRTYAGSGRVLPPSDINASQVQNGTVDGGNRPGKRNTNFVFGVAAAPTWNSSFSNGAIVRGVASQFRLGIDTRFFNQPLQFGLELRPEWDGVLGVFRVPLTVSVGKSDTFRIFAGPALSFGDASLSISGEDRRYSGGTSWFGAAGITFAPFSLKTARGNLAPYGELAWQSYSSDNSERNLSADFTAGFRFSTGLRYTWNIR